MVLRVLHIGKFYPPVKGGMEVFLADLVRAQRDMGIEACALVHGQAQADDPDWLVRVPVQVQLAYTPVALGFRSALAKAIERFEPDALHLHMPNNSVFLALTLAAAREVPWVVHWHADVVASKFRAVLALGYQLYRSFEQAVLERAERIFVTSPAYLAASEPLAAWREKCVVVPLGLAARALETREDISAESAGSPWHQGRLRLLSIGRLTYYKGFETLIRAVAALPGAQLVIVGAGELQSSLQALVRSTTPAGSQPAVKLLGEVSEADKEMLLETCDVFCLASRERTEAFGLVVLEAMRHARPCLVSDLAGSGLPWLVQQSGSGWLVETGNVAAWQAAIEHCAADPAERAAKGRAGHQALAARFSIAACAQAIETHYCTLLVAAAPPAQPGREILLIIAARDAGKTVGELVQSLREGGWNDVLLVSDHNVAGTAAAAQDAGARVLLPILPMGAWEGIQAGIRYGLSRGYQGVVTMDADDQHGAGELAGLLGRRAQADLVIGVSTEPAGAARRMAGRWFRRLAGFELRDLSCGLRYYNQAAMRILASREATLLDYQDLGTLLLLRRAGLRIVEVPVKASMGSGGKSRSVGSWVSIARHLTVAALLGLVHWKVRRGKSAT